MNMPELQEQMTKLEPYAKVHDNPHVQRWVEEMNQTLVDIDTAIGCGKFDSTAMKNHLAMLGIGEPKTPEEELMLYRAFQLMLGFMKRKLDLLKVQSANYEKTKRKIIELGKSVDIGSNRSVVHR